jgi:PAS domain S-box-containing protein
MQTNSRSTTATLVNGDIAEPFARAAVAGTQEMQQATGEGELYFRRMIDALPAAIYTTDAEGRITHFNQACIDLSGRTPELGSDHWCVTWKLFHPDGRPMPHDECPMAIALKERRIVRGTEAIAERPDGTRIWFKPYPTPLFDDEGHLIGGINMLVDITERKRAESTEAYLAAIVQSSDDAIISKNLDGIITSWNAGAERVYGYTAEEAIGQSITMLIPPDHLNEEPKIIERIRRGERVDHFETKRQRKDGTLLDISLTISPVRDNHGRIIGASKVARDITERKRADQALRDSEERFRQTLSLMPAAVYACDASGLITYYNEQAARLWGRAPAPGDTDERFCGSEQIILPDGTPLPHDQCPMAIALRKGRAFRDKEVNIRRPDGSLVTVMLNIDPIRDERGRVIGAINAFHEVTALKQAEEALRQRQAWLAGQREALETAVNGAPLETSLGVLVRTAIQGFAQDARAGFYLVNDEGTALHHVVGMPADYAEAVDGFKVGPNSLACGLATATGKPMLTSDVRCDPLWQPWLWMAEKFDYRGCWSFPIHTAAGKFVGTLAIYSRQPREATKRDVELGSLLTHTASIIVSRHKETESRKKAEQALRESEERFRMLADNMAQLAWTCDKLGNVTWYNQRWLDYTGLSFDEMRDWGWTKCHHPDHVDRVVASVTRSRESGEVWEDTFPLRRKDGQYRWFLSRAIPIRDAEGNVLRWFGTNTDVTDQLAAEEALREADRRKNEFLAMLAHELRNPLAPIRNAVQVLRLKGGDETIQSVTETMQRQVGQLVRMVDDLLDVNRISRGKIDLRTSRVELASIVQHAVEAIRPICENKSHDLSLTLPPQPVYLNADPARLAQVLANLLNNACKFTNSGGRISLSAEKEAEHVVIRVRDNGTGIAAGQLQRIFDMFTQVDTSLERSVGGLGIGLTLVKNLVEMHGGTVEAHSDGPGQGSEFVVTLPIGVAATEPQSPAPSVTKPATTTSRRILVVDDNRDSAKTMAMLLKLTGHQTNVAFDGLEAVAAAESFRPEVVLLDIGLPKLNGYETATRIRQQPWGKDMLLVALTGWGQDEDRQKSKDAGFDVHLVKPVDHTVLTKLLAESRRQPV